MRLATTAQMRDLEKAMVDEMGLSHELLMESAGLLAAREIGTTFLPEINRGPISVLCGSGNNGGDALVVARHLYTAGFFNLNIIRLKDLERQPSNLFNLQLSRIKKLGLKVLDLAAGDFASGALSWSEIIKASTLIVDGVYGTGFKVEKKIPEKWVEVFNLINSKKNAVVSLDIPSGLDSETGMASPQALKAQLTLTFGVPKPGLYLADGPENSKQIRCLKIGIPKNLIQKMASTHFAFDHRSARRWIPSRKKESNKSDHGRVLVYAGSPGMWGAAKLCIDAAYRMGAGYVTFVTKEKADAEKFMGGEIGSEALVKFIDDETLFDNQDAVVVGPGCADDLSLREFIHRLIFDKVKNVVLDATAFNVLFELRNTKLSEDWIITPHSGELGGLLGISASVVDANRVAAVRKASDKFGCLVLLKGFRSLISLNKNLMINLSGNSGLAKAGSGDVLAGFTAGLLAQGLNSWRSVGLATYIHGRLADEWLREGQDMNTLMPRDLLERLPQLLRQLRL